MDLKALAAPFPASDVEWRIGQAGKNARGMWAKALAYVTNRAIMERLDDVVGPGNWQNDYKPWTTGAAGVMCGIGILINGVWVWKWDGAEQPKERGEGQPVAVKGGFSMSMKRAAVQWGIGRYLYDLEEGFATITDNGTYYAPAKKDKYEAFHWNPPKLPDWALPGGSGKPMIDAPTKRSEARSERPAAKPVATSAPAKAAVPAKPDEDKMWGGKTLGEHTKDELDEIVRDFKNDPKPSMKALVAAARSVLNNRLLGPKPGPNDDSDDARVERMKAGVAADDLDLPF